MRLPVPSVPNGSAVVTVVLDATREHESGDQTVHVRWQDLRRSLAKQAVGAPLLGVLEERISVPTRVNGPHGRLLVAAEDEVLLDRLLVHPPAEDCAVVGDSPHAFALARVADGAVRYLLVAVDRSGADFSWCDTSAFGSANEHHSVEGGHDELAKSHLGGLGESRLEHRAEDSWERNAEAVAAEIDRLVAQRRPELVLLTGDVRAVGLVLAEVGAATREVLVEVDGGARAAGVNLRAFSSSMDRAVEAFRVQRREAVLERFRQESGRDGAAVSGVEDVVDVLRRGQVSELVVTSQVAGPPSSISQRTLWVGDGALELGRTADDVRQLGVAEPKALPADVALGRAALEQGAGITVADAASVTLVDGVGALLRWHDAATPGETAYTQSRDRTRP